MKISTRGRYAVRILLDVASHQEEGSVAMKDITARQQISKKYGDQIAMRLVQSGILTASRGRQGGYRLSRSPQDISLLQILQTVEGSVEPVQCLDVTPNPCERCAFCATLPVWTGLGSVIKDYLKGVSLADMLHGSPEPSGPCGENL